DGRRASTVTGVQTFALPIYPYEPQHVPKGGRKHVIGLFGFLTSAKRADVVLEAFRQARAAKREVRLLVVGEPAPNIDTTAFSGEIGRASCRERGQQSGGADS